MKKFTRKGHKKAARIIREIKKGAFDLKNMIGPAYGVTSKAYKLACKIPDATELKSELDESWLRETGTIVGSPYYEATRNRGTKCS